MQTVSLMGTNAITVKGELVNIDGAETRVACLIHGPKQVIIVVGMNKIVRSIEDGIDRIQGPGFVRSLQMLPAGKRHVV